MSLLYLDHNATTPLLPEARAAVVDALDRAWGNPSSSHALGRAAAAVVSEARAAVAEAVGAEPDEVVFVSGATEGIRHAVHAAGPGRVLLSAVEHPAVPAALGVLPDREAEVLPVGRDGRVDPGEVLRRVDAGPRPALVAIMAANNETGVLQPVADLEGPLRERGVPFLVDAVQLAGKLPVDVRPDFLVLAAHKLGGPKGVGALVVRRGVDLPPLIPGGGQEGRRRGGTEPVPAIAGFGAAMRVVVATRDDEAKRLAGLRDRLQAGLLDALPGSQVVGAGAPRLPNTLSLILPAGCEAGPVVEALDAEGVCVSAGSACHEGDRRPSAVLTAMGWSPDEAFRALRLSLGRTNGPEDVDRVLALLPRLVREATA